MENHKEKSFKTKLALLVEYFFFLINFLNQQHSQLVFDQYYANILQKLTFILITNNRYY